MVEDLTVDVGNTSLLQISIYRMMANHRLLRHHIKTVSPTAYCVLRKDQYWQYCILSDYLAESDPDCLTFVDRIG